MTTLPKTIFVKVEKSRNDTYFMADESAARLVEMDEKITVGRYQLVDTLTVEGVAKLSSSKKR